MIFGDLLSFLAMGIIASNAIGNDLSDQSEEAYWIKARENMVQQLRAYHITDASVLNAMQKVRRHLFIPERMRDRRTAYGDHPCQIGCQQTISQPFIVAHMTSRLQIEPGEKVLEIGTGSGYQAAVLAECGAQVFSIELIPELAHHAREALNAEGYSSVQIKTGNGYEGWMEHSPFDAIILTCAPDEYPPALVRQLRAGGRMIAPIGTHFQRLVILRKIGGELKTEEDLAVRFVPMRHLKP